jgi:hypothetical protein
MSENGERIDPITAEHLIRGDGANTHRRDPLAELLAAAASPARPRELIGEEAAVMAFRSAHLAQAPESRRRSMLKTALTKLATAKAALAVIAVSGGGVALAAGSGHLPGTGSPDTHPTARPDISASARHDETHSAHPAAPATTSAPKATAPQGSPSPNLRGLCTAFNAGVGDNPGKALDNPAFTALINAAGGKDAVSGYCVKLLGAAKTKSADHSNGTPANGTPAHGTPHATPSARPSGVPDPHASGSKHTPSHTAPVPPTTPSH